MEDIKEELNEMVRPSLALLIDLDGEQQSPSFLDVTVINAMHCNRKTRAMSMLKNADQIKAEMREFDAKLSLLDKVAEYKPEPIELLHQVLIKANKDVLDGNITDDPQQSVLEYLLCIDFVKEIAHPFFKQVVTFLLDNDLSFTDSSLLFPLFLHFIENAQDTEAIAFFRLFRVIGQVQHQGLRATSTTRIRFTASSKASSARHQHKLSFLCRGPFPS